MELDRIEQLHPCFGALHRTGRMHLPVCPGCNIECRFCERKLDTVSERPGVSSTILKPEATAEYVERALQFCPEITVIGIAGPGDTLTGNEALSTFKLIGDKFPNLIKCMSTNGLLLAERADEVIDAKIDTLTVTVNAVDPLIQAQIIDSIIFHNQRYSGVDAAQILIANQLAGIAKVAAAGVKVKVNTVLISEINLLHIKEIAKAVAASGAHLYNIIPLIPQHKLNWCCIPTFEEITLARKEAGQYMKLFLHCQRCRADAVGIPGKTDFSQPVYLGRSLAKATFSHG